MKEFTIGRNEAGQRFDKFVVKVLKDAPSSLIYKLIRKKSIELNGKKADSSEKLKEGDCVKFFLSDETFEKFAGHSNLRSESKISTMPHNKAFSKVRIIYEDQDVLLLHKPAGILSQKAEPTDESMVEYVIDYAMKKNILKEDHNVITFKPGICNRLDRNTSGLMAAGLSLEGLQVLNQMIQERSVKKYYLAIVKGIPSKKKECLLADHIKNHETNTVTISAASAPDAYEKNGAGQAKHIITQYEVLDESNGQFGQAALLLVHLVTGQTHQIRAHLASIGYPLAGDAKYGDAAFNRYCQEHAGIRRQMLHSYELQFPESMDQLKQLSGRHFRCVPDGDFLKALLLFGLKLPD